MFKPTKPYNDTVTNYPKEPSLRIGKTVPKNAVNLAYYFNPTATDAEKILTAEAPRNTIDHRVEEAYRYLFNQATDDDNLFPGFVYYEDEEGYQGRLGRMYVNWYPEAHVNVKNVTQQKDIIVVDKEEVPKFIEYNDIQGYSGNLYLDAVEYKVTKTKDVTEKEVVDRTILNHELSFNKIFGTYIAPGDLDAWMNPPTATMSTYWPNEITINLDMCTASGGNNTVKNYVDKTPNPYDKAIGSLVFDKLEYEQVKNPKSSNQDGEIKSYNISGVFTSDNFSYTGNKSDIDALKKYINDCKNKVRKVFLSSYNAEYNPTSDKYDYEEIEDFLQMADKYGPGRNSQFYTIIRQAMAANYDISVYFDRMDMVEPSGSSTNAIFSFEARYKYKISDRGAGNATYLYNVVAVYKTTTPLKKTITRVKEIASEYSAHAYYVGLTRKVWYDYDGVAYYRGAVTKGNAIGNMNPENNNEILMFSDSEGYLRRPVYKTDENGEVTLKNFYRVESDYVYLTDVFKNGKACFYKYKLKKPIYDYRGPDSNGFYCGNAVKICTAGLKDLPNNYEYSMKLKVADYEIVNDIAEDYTISSKKIPKRYEAELYTSFISSSTDTFKVVYNAFDDNDNDNVALDNGVIEDVYNYPFMISDQHFKLEAVDIKARVNKIKLDKPYRIRDSRLYITFTYIVKAVRKGQIEIDEYNGVSLTKSEAIIKSEKRTVSILNKDYALPCEYDKFDQRAMIISELKDGIYLSPFDIILMDQAARRGETLITPEDTDFIFSVEIVECSNQDRGGINIKCNTDGSGYITAETTIDTGFIDANEDLMTDLEVQNAQHNFTHTFTKKLDLDSPYFVEQGYIYPGIKVKCVDTKHIKVNAPREENLLQSWYPMIQFGHYSQILDQYGTHVKVCYSMPEYDTQYFSPIHKKPYVDINEEKVQILNSHMVKTQCYPLFVKEGLTTILLFKKIDNEYFSIRIENISYSDGVIITKDAVSENDNIICNYTYVEENYIYRGFWRNVNDFARIDLNPNMYHTYSDTTYLPSETKPSKNLFNKVIYFFMRPTVEYEVDADNDSLIFDVENDNVIGKPLIVNESTLYHQINNAHPESDHDIYIGSVYIRQNTSLHSTILVDSRTRGGGVLSSIKDSLRQELEPESDYYLDIGYYDGEPYQENGVIVVRLDNSLLKEFGGRFTQGDIESKVKRWLGTGVYPIIEYVDSYTKQDMPQYTLEVEDTYTNVIDETPELILESVIV